MMTKKRFALSKGLATIYKPMFLKNSLETGTVFYGLHMSEGLAHYKPPGEEEFTVFVGNDTIKLMNSTFAGKPVYVGHVDEHTPLADADGVVAESFYNPVDGKHWSKFIITTQKGLDAIANGWQLSNSLLVNQHSNGGEWHGLTFDRTVDKGTFHHMAIVPNPRYGESVILTPDEFKQYNKNKQAELEMLSNSKENTTMFKLFKNEAQDDKKTKELLGMSVVLPKTKRTVTVEQLCNEADSESSSSEEAEIDMDGVKKKISEFIKEFKDLQKQYSDLKSEFDSLEIIGSEAPADASAESEEEQLSNSDDSEDDDLDDSGDMEDEDHEDDVDGELDEDDLDALDAADEVKAKLDNASATPAKKQAVKKGAMAKKLKNAADKAQAKLNNSGTKVVDLSSDQIKRGAARYGSSKK